MTTVLIGQNEELPNIKGTMKMYALWGGTMPDAFADGAFETIYNYHTGAFNGNGSYAGSYDGFRLDASKLNTAYKDNGKVTTKNLTVRYWKRTA